LCFNEHVSTAPALSDSVVAILDADGTIKGTGFLAAPRLVLTCAHVVDKDSPKQLITVRFCVNNETCPAQLLKWEATNDLAVLKLQSDAPLAACALEIASPEGSLGNAFKSFGYRRVDGVEAVTAEGKIIDFAPATIGQRRLQLSSKEPRPGMSGSPVLDTHLQKVVGMMAGGSQEGEIVLAIPGDALLQALPQSEPPGLWPLGHTYATSPNFTGRKAERDALSGWLTNGPTVLVIRALGGFGKSALTWHWLNHNVDRARWPRAFWWNFYDQREFDAFLADALTAFDIDPKGLGPRQQADKLLELVAQPGTLLILDGFERALRAFSGMGAAYQGDTPSPSQGDSPSPSQGEGAGGWGSERACISPIAEHFLKSAASRQNLRGRVLITTRLRPGVLEGHDQRLLEYSDEIELKSLHPADAVALFQAEGINGTRAEIETACAPYGYHPLSLRLLAGWIVNDLRQPGDIAVAQRLDVSGDQVQRQHHVLEQSFNSLIPPRRKLLSRLACFREPMPYDAIQAITEGTTDARSLDAHLHDLIGRGLVHHDRASNRYDLHPIVRRYAYDRLADRPAAHERLRGYFVIIEVPRKFKTLDELAPLIELYWHTVRAELYDEARTLFRDRISRATFYQFGAYQLEIELLRALFPDGEDRPPRLKDEDDQGWTLNELANSYSLSGQPRRAVALGERHNTLREKRGDQKNLAIGLGNVADDQGKIGALRAAEANMRRSIDLCLEIEDEFQEAIWHQALGRLLAYRGVWAEAGRELAASSHYWQKTNDVQGLCLDEAYRALAALLFGRAEPTGQSPFQRDALAAARRALELADEDARTDYPVERDYVRTHWLLGAAYRATEITPRPSAT